MSESRREKEGSTRGHGRQLCAPRPKGHGNVKARVRHLDSPPLLPRRSPLSNVKVRQNAGRAHKEWHFYGTRNDDDDNDGAVKNDRV